MDQIQIAILIPVYNALEFTKRCLLNLQTGFSQIDKKEAVFKIVVIDDGSNDGTEDWIDNNFNNIILLKGDGNLWWSGAINKGAEYVLKNQIANYTLWWNNDVSVDSDYFIELVKHIKESDKKTIIGPKIYDLETGKVWSMGGMFNTRTGVYHQGGNKNGSNDLVIEADWLPGMGTLIPVKAYQDVGWLDYRNFPQYHGDLDFTLRCKLSGYKILVFSNLKMYNDKANSGFDRKESWNDLLYSLKSLKSLYNIKRDIALYKKHTATPFSYFQLFKKYYEFFGGFLKWKLLTFVGIKRTKYYK